MVLMQVKAATARQVAAAAAKAPAAAAAAIIRKLSISRHRNHKWQPIMKASPRSSIRSSLAAAHKPMPRNKASPKTRIR